MKYYLTIIEGNGDAATDIWREVDATHMVHVKRLTGRYKWSDDGPILTRS